MGEWAFAVFSRLLTQHIEITTQPRFLPYPSTLCVRKHSVSPPVTILREAATGRAGTPKCIETVAPAPTLTSDNGGEKHFPSCMAPSPCHVLYLHMYASCVISSLCGDAQEQTQVDWGLMERTQSLSLIAIRSIPTVDFALLKLNLLLGYRWGGCVASCSWRPCVIHHHTRNRPRLPLYPCTEDYWGAVYRSYVLQPSWRVRGWLLPRSRDDISCSTV